MRKKNQKDKDGLIKQRGFLVIEIPIGLFIVGVVLLIYVAASNTVVLNRSAKERDLANQIAVSEIEDLREMSFGLLPGSGPLAHPLLAQLPSGAGHLIVTNVATDLKQFDVIVTWWDRSSNTTKSLRITTLIGKNGL